MEARNECVWFDQARYELAEAKFQTIQADRHAGLKVEGKGLSIPNSISTEIEKAMDLIGKSLNSSSIVANPADLEKRVSELEKENAQFKTTLNEIMERLSSLESNSVREAKAREDSAQLVLDDTGDDDDDNFDLFDSVDTEETEKLSEERRKYAEKKASKPKAIAKSSLILDIKPWDDETDLSDMERQVRSIATDGLLWGASKLLPVAYGIKKLQISCVIEDDKVGTDFLEDNITSFEDLVQSVDIVAFNKI